MNRSTPLPSPAPKPLASWTSLASLNDPPSAHTRPAYEVGRKGSGQPGALENMFFCWQQKPTVLLGKDFSLLPGFSSKDPVLSNFLGSSRSFLLMAETSQLFENTWYLGSKDLKIFKKWMRQVSCFNIFFLKSTYEYSEVTNSWAADKLSSSSSCNLASTRKTNIKKQDIGKHPSEWKKGFKKQVTNALEKSLERRKSNFRLPKLASYSQKRMGNVNWLPLL